MNLRDLFSIAPKFPPNLEKNPKSSFMDRKELPGRPQIFADEEGRRFIPDPHLRGFLERVKRDRSMPPPFIGPETLQEVQIQRKPELEQIMKEMLKKKQK